jgi:hypothetical protein
LSWMTLGKHARSLLVSLATERKGLRSLAMRHRNIGQVANVAR